MKFDESHEHSILEEILLRKSVRFGNFQLASGETSDVYIDCKPTTCSAEAMPLIGRIFLRKMQEKRWLPEAVGGLMVGAEPIAFAIARESLETPHHIGAFIVRKERKPHGMQKIVEGLDPTNGCPVVIIDDVCTKGGSTAMAIENAQLAGMRVLGAICLVDRQQGATELLASRFGCALESIFKLSELRAKHDESYITADAVETKV
jgi:orotate phosphoribosyltransferase